MNVKQGDALPIELQIENNDGSKFPTAVLRDENNTILATLNLVHIQDGLYDSPTPFTMGTQEYITVQYLIYDDASRLNISTDIGSSHDIFIREEFSASGGGATVDQEIIGVIAQNKISATLLLPFKINATIKKHVLKASLVSRDAITGLVQGANITATIKQNKITGTVEC